MASYLDMVTVLMCMFIVLFAMSTVDAGKFKALAGSLAAGFSQQVAPAPTTTPDPDTLAASTEYDALRALQAKLQAALKPAGLDRSVTFAINERGLTVGLVGADTYFATNSTTLSRKATTVLGAIGTVLAGVGNQISVEGHADRRGAAAPFATNWELSAARATQVLRYLVEAGGVDPGHVRSVGFGDARPLAKGDSAAALAQNRRVDIVILSGAAENVRRLLPALDGAR